MSLLLENFDEWYEHFYQASPQEQHQLLLEAISQPIPLDFALKEDITALLLDVQGLLEGNNLIDQALAFLETFQEKQPELYQQEFQYFNNFPVRVALFNRKLDSMGEALARYQQEPIKSIDSLLPVLDDFRFYDACAQAVEVSRAVYDRVATGKGLVGRAEETFGDVVIADLLEQAYQQIQQGNPVDWETWGQEAEAFGLTQKPELRQEIAKTLSGEVLDGPDLITLFQENLPTAILQLSLRFSIQMAKQSQLSFVCSQAIWSRVVEDCLGRQELSQKQRSNPDLFFTLKAKDLDHHVGGLIGGFLSFYQAAGFATLWGIPHVYDFLRTTGMITDSVYESAIKVATNLQGTLLKHWQQPLWRYSFIHLWGKPAYQTESDFEAEAKRFADTFNESEPLSTTPYEKTSWEESLSEAAKTMAPSREGEKQSKRGSSSTQPAKPPKSPKPRKSPLQEIKSLGKKGKGAKKGKGF